MNLAYGPMERDPIWRQCSIQNAHPATQIRGKSEIRSWNRGREGAPSRAFQKPQRCCDAAITSGTGTPSRSCLPESIALLPGYPRMLQRHVAGRQSVRPLLVSVQGCLGLFRHPETPNTANSGSWPACRVRPFSETLTDFSWAALLPP